MNTTIYSLQLGQFFNELNFQYKIYQCYKRQTDRFLATDFNSFNYISPDENKLSKIIADLLSPQGNHGQDMLFLQLFIAMQIDILRPDATQSAQTTNLQLLQTIKHTLANPQVKIKVSTEPKTSYIQNNLRRMDILIEINQYGVMIENKPWAQDQNNQLFDYIAHLRICFPKGFIAVYLSGDGASPDQSSLPNELKEDLMKSGQYVEMNYSHFLKVWLQACQQRAEADKVRMFLGDFIDYIDETFYITQ